MHPESSCFLLGIPSAWHSAWALDCWIQCHDMVRNDVGGLQSYQQDPFMDRGNWNVAAHFLQTLLFMTLPCQVWRFVMIVWIRTCYFLSVGNPPGSDWPPCVQGYFCLPCVSFDWESSSLICSLDCATSTNRETPCHHRHWVTFTFINDLALPPMCDSWWNASSAVNMGGMVLSVPSCFKCFHYWKHSKHQISICMHIHCVMWLEFNCGFCTAWYAQYQNCRYNAKSGLNIWYAPKLPLHLIVLMITHKMAASYFNGCSCPWSILQIRSQLTALTSPLNRNHHISMSFCNFQKN
jgi:hypothetical protein